MNIYDSVIEIKTKLAAKGLTAEVDPYKEVDPPYVLIEAERSTGVEYEAGCSIITGFHTVTISCITSAQNTDFTTHKHDLADQVTNVLSYLTELTTVTVKPLEVTYGELMIGSLRCTGAVITCEVYFM